jgi:hypothetical protein
MLHIPGQPKSKNTLPLSQSVLLDSSIGSKSVIFEEVGAVFLDEFFYSPSPPPSMSVTVAF